MNAYVIENTGRVLPAQPAKGLTFTFEELVAIIGTGELDYVSTHDNKIMVIDLNGLGKTENRINVRASLLYRQSVCNTKGLSFEHSLVTGKVLVCKPEMIKS